MSFLLNKLYQNLENRGRHVGATHNLLLERLTIVTPIY
jgi:hypothetical protein